MLPRIGFQANRDIGEFSNERSLLEDFAAMTGGERARLWMEGKIPGEIIKDSRRFRTVSLQAVVLLEDKLHRLAELLKSHCVKNLRVRKDYT